MADRIPPPAAAIADTHCTAEQYDALYARSLADPDGFWAEQARRIDWVTAPEKIANWSYDPVEIKWFEDGVLNLCYNCVDRHLAARAADSRDHLGGRRAGRDPHAQLWRTARRGGADGEQPEGARAPARATGSPSICR